MFAVLLTAGCSSGAPPAEEQRLTEFFSLSRLWDQTALARVSTVAFNPRTDGIVDHFTVVSVAPEERRPRTGSDADQALVARSLPLMNDATTHRADVIARRISVQADLRLPDGRRSSRRLTITLERVRVTATGGPAQGRWIVTGWRDGD